MSTTAIAIVCATAVVLTLIWAAVRQARTNSELAKIRPSIDRLLRAQGRMLTDWAKADHATPDGITYREALWNELHYAAEGLEYLLEQHDGKQPRP